jgi:hypothetical protein
MILMILSSTTVLYCCQFISIILTGSARYDVKMIPVIWIDRLMIDRDDKRKEEVINAFSRLVVVCCDCFIDRLVIVLRSTKYNVYYFIILLWRLEVSSSIERIRNKVGIDQVKKNDDVTFCTLELRLSQSSATKIVCLPRVGSCKK